MPSPKAEAFEAHLYDRVAAALRGMTFDRTGPKAAALGWPQSPQDIYALSFYLWAEDNDPRQYVLEVSYNTTARVERCTPGSGKTGRHPASDAAEAKWNYAFWMQEPIAKIGAAEDRADRTIPHLRKEWLEEAGLFFTDDEAEDVDKLDEIERKIEHRFWPLVARVAARLHHTGVIAKIFGRPIPILIHDLEFADPSFACIREANPPGLADEFFAAFGR